MPDTILHRILRSAASTFIFRALHSTSNRRRRPPEGFRPRANVALTKSIKL